MGCHTSFICMCPITFFLIGLIGFLSATDFGRYAAEGNGPFPEGSGADSGMQGITEIAAIQNMIQSVCSPSFLS